MLFQRISLISANFSLPSLSKILVRLTKKFMLHWIKSKALKELEIMINFQKRTAEKHALNWHCYLRRSCLIGTIFLIITGFLWLKNIILCQFTNKAFSLRLELHFIKRSFVKYFLYCFCFWQSFINEKHVLPNALRHDIQIEGFWDL